MRRESEALAHNSQYRNAVASGPLCHTIERRLKGTRRYRVSVLTVPPRDLSHAQRRRQAEKAYRTFVERVSIQVDGCAR